MQPQQNRSERKKSLSNPLPPAFVGSYRPYDDAARANTPHVGLNLSFDCRSHWNAYYRNNTLNGYKDRHYILREFHELREALGIHHEPTGGNGDGDNDELEEEDDTLATAGTGDDDATAPVRDDDTQAAGNRSSSHHQQRAADAVGSKKHRCEHVQTSSRDDQKPSLTGGIATLVEVGCGVGNTILPLLHGTPRLRGVGFDISSVAVRLFGEQAATLGVGDRCAAAVVDIAKQRAPPRLLAGDAMAEEEVEAAQAALAGPEDLSAPHVEFASLVFVLCSVPVDRMPYAVETAARVLQPGTGVLFWRDYAAGDMAEQRFDAAQRGVGDGDGHTFARTNGTLSHFFEEAEVRRLFAPHFDVIELRRVERTVVNRKTGCEMPRLWWQGRFRRRPL